MADRRQGGIVTEEMSRHEFEGLELMMVRSRDLGYSVFDSDNHLYERPEALTKFLPDGYKDLIRYIQINDHGRIRDRLAVDNQIAGFIPNPTFARVAPPGGQANDPDHRRSIAGSDAFFDPDARVRLMDEFGIQRALLFPTLTGTVEPYLLHDVRAYHVAIHAMNQWFHEHWTYNYQDRIYAAPMVPLNILGEAIKELEYVLAHGAKAIWVRPTPVMGLDGPRSFALPEFDPFWKLVQDADILVGMHTAPWRLDQPTDPWQGGNLARNRTLVSEASSPAFLRLATPEPTLADGLASLIGHGLATRFPKLRCAPIEFHIDPLEEFVERVQRAYEEAPVLFDEDPYVVLRRNVFIHNFQDPDPANTVRLMGVDNVMFGSDFPHVEGMNDPLAFSDRLLDMSFEDQAKLMGGNMARIMKVEA